MPPEAAGTPSPANSGAANGSENRPATGSSEGRARPRRPPQNVAQIKRKHTGAAIGGAASASDIDSDSEDDDSGSGVGESKQQNRTRARSATARDCDEDFGDCSLGDDGVVSTRTDFRKPAQLKALRRRLHVLKAEAESWPSGCNGAAPRRALAAVLLPNHPALVGVSLL